MDANPTSVARRFATLKGLEQALGIGDPDDAETTADALLDALAKSAKTRIEAFAAVGLVPVATRGRSSKTDGQDNRRDPHALSYWAEIEYPDVVVLRRNLRLSLPKRWAEAIAAVRFRDAPPFAVVASFVAQAVVGVVGVIGDIDVVDYLTNEMEEAIFGFFAQRDLLDETGTTTEVGPDGKDVEVAGMGAHYKWHLTPKAPRVTAKVEGNDVVVTVEREVDVAVSEILFPGDHEYDEWF